MNKRNLNQKINHAFSALPPDTLPEYLLSACTKQKGEQPMKENRRINKTFRRVLSLAIALALVVVSGITVRHLYLDQAIASVVSLDVNPSIRIDVNKKEKVLAVSPLNEDAKTIIGTMDFKGSNLDVAVNALIGSMVQKGYISELSNSVLISVDHKNKEEATRLQQKLTDEIDGLLHTAAFDGAVLSQTVTADDTLTHQAAEKNISVGKAQLIQKILTLLPQRTFEELTDLTINELNLLLGNGKNSDINTTGTASQKAYIGGEKAKEAAFKHAGVTAEQVQFAEVETDYERGVFCYSVEFNAAGYEYEYDINAKTGEIVKHEKERDDDAFQTPSASVPSTDVSTGNTDQSKPAETPTQPDQTAYITKDAAKKAALSHAKVSADTVREFEIELDLERGKAIYEIDFDSGRTEYSYEIDALTGAILKSNKETDD